MTAGEPTFYPVSVYALDAVSHQAVKGRACRPMPICTAPDPMPAGNGKDCLPPGAIACLILPSHQGPTICLICWLPGAGIYRLSDPWLEGLQARGAGAACLARPVPDPAARRSPFQGACIQQEIQGLGLPCHWVQDGEGCLKALEEGGVRLLICDLSLAERDAISLLMSHPQYRHSGLPIILLSARDQTP